MSLEELLKQHIEADHEDFRLVHEKLDKLLAEVATIKGQWKLVGAIAGTMVGIAASLIFGG